MSWFRRKKAYDKEYRRRQQYYNRIAFLGMNYRG
jgi:hypothetical protein